MSTRLDPACFPRAHAYLAGLPGKLDAYPDCVILADFHLQVLADFPTVLEPLPRTLAAVLAPPRVAGDWMPLAHFMFTQLLAFEGCLRSDEAAYAARIRERSSKLFGHPLYRHLMQLVSPNLMLMGASRRLETFVRGITYRLDGFTRHAHVARMTMPPHSLEQFGIDFFASTFTAAIEAAGARDVRVGATLVSPGEATFRGTWT